MSDPPRLPARRAAGSRQNPAEALTQNFRVVRQAPRRRQATERISGRRATRTHDTSILPPRFGIAPHLSGWFSRMLLTGLAVSLGLVSSEHDYGMPTRISPNPTGTRSHARKEAAPRLEIQ